MQLWLLAALAGVAAAALQYGARAFQIRVLPLALLRAVVGIGSGFNATTLAEGIETEEQLRKLRAEGFSEVQGFLLGTPMQQAEAEALIYGGASPLLAATGS